MQWIYVRQKHINESLAKSGVFESIGRHTWTTKGLWGVWELEVERTWAPWVDLGRREKWHVHVWTRLWSATMYSTAMITRASPTNFFDTHLSTTTHTYRIVWLNSTYIYKQMTFTVWLRRRTYAPVQCCPVWAESLACQQIYAREILFNTGTRLKGCSWLEQGPSKKKIKIIFMRENSSWTSL